jgi:hypothetical protein
MRRWSILLLALSIPSARTAHAQTDRLARGSHSYITTGTGMGADMPPWESQMTVRDTAIDGRPAVRLHYGSRLNGNQWRFNTWSAFTSLPDSDFETLYQGNSRAGERECRVRVADKTIAAVGASTSVRSGPFDIPAVPEMMVAHVVSGLPLANDMKLQLRVFRCEDASYSDPIRMWQLNATVSSATHKRSATSAAEPVWIVAGDATYAYRAVIAKSDAMVLRFEVPQGTEGSMVMEYRNTRPVQ